MNKSLLIYCREILLVKAIFAPKKIDSDESRNRRIAKRR